MNITGEMLRFYVPELVRRRAIRELYRATAVAFDVSIPLFKNASADELLAGYALFTAEHASAALRTQGVDLAVIKERLYSSAYTIGSRLRRQLEVRSTAEAMTVARSVYGILHIDFRAGAQGEVRIPHCFFSRFYSAEVCGLMSSLDKGLVAGLSGGGRLEFRQRITEGAAWCAASFAEVSR